MGRGPFIANEPRKQRTGGSSEPSPGASWLAAAQGSRRAGYSLGRFGDGPKQLSVFLLFDTSSDARNSIYSPPCPLPGSATSCARAAKSAVSSNFGARQGLGSGVPVGGPFYLQKLNVDRHNLVRYPIVEPLRQFVSTHRIAASIRGTRLSGMWPNAYESRLFATQPRAVRIAHEGTNEPFKAFVRAQRAAGAAPSSEGRFLSSSKLPSPAPTRSAVGSWGAVSY